MPNGNSVPFSMTTFLRDLTSGMVVFLVALPLCLGVASAIEGVPSFAGILAGIIGGLLVGLLSGSHTSVTGPSPALAAIVATQLALLGSFEALLLAVVIAGLMQIGLALLRAGFIAAYFPTSVIKGLLAAVGIILILKQIPHLLGHDADPEGDMAFLQPDNENTFSEFVQSLFDVNEGAALIGLVSLALLFSWNKCRPLKKSTFPVSLVVIVVGVCLNLLLRQAGGIWLIEESHLVNVRVAHDVRDFLTFFQGPDFSKWADPDVYAAGLMIALVATLETLLNLEAADKLDPMQRTSPANRELLAQGLGNLTGGLLGGIPVTSAIIRSSVNINSVAQSKLSTIIHGALLLLSVLLLPRLLNLIPLSCLAAILLATGAKLASPRLFKQMWSEGRYQFIPFLATVIAIVFTDLLIGILIGLAVAIGFILSSNLRRPARRFVEKHLGGDVLRIQLANQVSFLNRAALVRVLDSVPRGGQVLLDAQETDYIDPDVLDLIRDFKEETAPARNVTVSFLGFRDKYRLSDHIQYVDYSTRDIQEMLTPPQVLDILKEGNERFRTGQRLTRDLGRLVQVTAAGQHPLAIILSCIDSRAPAELIFDCGVGDIFNVRIAGNILSRKVLGSMEYACGVAGAKLILVMGHTRCGAIGTAVKRACDPSVNIGDHQHVDFILRDIDAVIDPAACKRYDQMTPAQRDDLSDAVARANVLNVAARIPKESPSLAKLLAEGRIAIVPALYDVSTGRLEFLS